MDFHCHIPSIREDVEMIREILYAKSAQRGNRSAVVTTLLLPAIERWKIENADKIDAWKRDRKQDPDWPGEIQPQ